MQKIKLIKKTGAPAIGKVTMQKKTATPKIKVNRNRYA